MTREEKRSHPRRRVLNTMRRGDYVEVEGELRSQKEARTVVVCGDRSVVEHDSYATYAIRVTRLDRPDALVDYGDSDDKTEEAPS